MYVENYSEIKFNFDDEDILESLGDSVSGVDLDCSSLTATNVLKYITKKVS